MSGNATRRPCDRRQAGPLTLQPPEFFFETFGILRRLCIEGTEYRKV